MGLLKTAPRVCIPVSRNLVLRRPAIHHKRTSRVMAIATSNTPPPAVNSAWGLHDDTDPDWWSTSPSTAVVIRFEIHMVFEDLIRRALLLKFQC